MAEPATPPQQDSELAKQREALESWAKKLDLAVVYRSEAGVFQGSASKSAKDILNRVKNARLAAEEGKFAEAHELVSLGFTELHSAVQARGFWWRLVHIHAVPVYAYYLVFLVGLMLIGLWVDQATTLWGVPIVVVVFGTLGGVLRGLWWIYKKVQSRTLRPQFTMVYIAGPWLGGLLGMFAWVLVKGGLLFLAGPGGDDASDGQDITTTTEGVNAVAFLAGYSWEWVVGRVRELADSE